MYIINKEVIQILQFACLNVNMKHIINTIIIGMVIVIIYVVEILIQNHVILPLLHLLFTNYIMKHIVEMTVYRLMYNSMLIMIIIMQINVHNLLEMMVLMQKDIFIILHLNHHNVQIIAINI